MEMHLTVHGRQDLAGQIYRQLRTAILDQRLPEGERLPSTRELAAQLGVSRKTTLDAYERLTAEGFLCSRPGDGTFVAEGLARLRETPTPPAPRAAPRALWDSLPPALAMPGQVTPLPYDFMGGVTDKRLFPFDTWRSCIHHALRIQARGRGTYRDTAGEQELRLAVARYLGFNRALATNWQDVLITQGAQQALDLMARTIVGPGDVVAVEEPGYPPARASFLAQGARVVGVPVDAEGLVVEALPPDARLVYVTPSHQFPLGMPMSLERRIQLLEWAHEHGAVIIEDDYDGEFRFEGRPMEPLKTLDRSGLVAYVGTFSKTIFPELRIGYLVSPASLIDALRKVRQIGDWHSCALTQNALAKFMLDGDFAKHLRRMHKHYAARRQTLLGHLTGALAPWFEPIVPAAGIHLVARFRQPLSEAQLIAAAREAAIGLYGISGFHAQEPRRQGMLFGYGGIDADEIDKALNILAGLLPKISG
ncbi:PLP-dependent aminotransferase family protein [Azoarcus sp. KH32C]|uniref:MocR-like pyridoxine biosynthesis transcription factor PdxR n=1 Tax=Azoarcus sp. KH32C TaxID=748247 RepID=UPI0002386C49|nr:PLP-dependent aminotransferase family protein [Azoarcus sp. KH32C]BAL23845.1 transcriptional regulator, GntR family [Azoarcus sp. KH32C]